MASWGRPFSPSAPGPARSSGPDVTLRTGGRDRCATVRRVPAARPRRRRHSDDGSGTPTCDTAGDAAVARRPPPGHAHRRDARRRPRPGAARRPRRPAHAPALAPRPVPDLRPAARRGGGDGRRGPQPHRHQRRRHARGLHGRPARPPLRGAARGRADAVRPDRRRRVGERPRSDRPGHRADRADRPLAARPRRPRPHAAASPRPADVRPEAPRAVPRDGAGRHRPPARRRH